MRNFSNVFDKILYMFRTGPLSIIRNISTLYTRNRYNNNNNYYYYYLFSIPAIHQSGYRTCQ